MPVSSQVVTGVEEGDILDGKYRIERVIGTGGMGVVVAAHHLQLDERVAIKFLLPEALTNTETVARFAREARAAVKIKSEHVARVLDVGTLPHGAPYMVMEYLEGSDLASWLVRKGPLPVEQAVEFVLQACQALAEAHGMGIVHRDLKPGNLFCVRGPDGRWTVKLLDFGISKFTGFHASLQEMRITTTTAVMGSPLYMSPEQLRSSHQADARSDIWSLGVILYELVSGNAPFMGESLPDLFMNIVNVPAAPLRGTRQSIPVGIEEVIAKCLEKDRNQRYQDVAELAHALGPFAPKEALIAVERISAIIDSSRPRVMGSRVGMAGASGTAPQPPGATAASWGTTAAPHSTRRTRMFMGFIGVLAIVGILAFVMLWQLHGRSTGSVAVATGAPAGSALVQVSGANTSAPSSLQPQAEVPPQRVEPTGSQAAPAHSSKPRSTRHQTVPVSVASSAAPNAGRPSPLSKTESPSAQAVESAPPGSPTPPRDIFGDRK